MSGSHSNTLRSLAADLYSGEEIQDLLSIADLDEQGMFRWQQIFAFDEHLGGPGVHNIHRPDTNWAGAEGRYHRGDRDIFRPLQYCAVYLQLQDPNAIPWLSREIVHMAGLHLETLAKSIVNAPLLALGQLLRFSDSLIQRKVGKTAWQQLRTFTDLYNAAKHSLDQEKDSHLFAPSDAVMAYFIARKLAATLFPHARLSTPPSTWEHGPTVHPTDVIWRS